MYFIIFLVCLCEEAIYRVLSLGYRFFPHDLSMPKIKNSRTFYLFHDMKTTSKEKGSWHHIIGCSSTFVSSTFLSTTVRLKLLLWTGRLLSFSLCPLFSVQNHQPTYPCLLCPHSTSCNWSSSISSSRRFFLCLLVPSPWFCVAHPSTICTSGMHLQLQQGAEG